MSKVIYLPKGTKVTNERNTAVVRIRESSTCKVRNYVSGQRVVTIPDLYAENTVMHLSSNTFHTIYVLGYAIGQATQIETPTDLVGMLLAPTKD